MISMGLLSTLLSNCYYKLSLLFHSMDDTNEDNHDSSTDISCDLPLIIELSKSNKFADCPPIIISETKTHTKRLSFRPKIFPSHDDCSLLKGHLVYEPIKKGNSN
jgi:hypothetical protein